MSEHLEKVLKIEDLAVSFNGISAVSHISFDIHRGETVALVGESGSGKSVTALSILQLLPYPTASHPTGSIKVAGIEAIHADNATLRSIRGAKVSMIFQEPMTSLNPLHTIEKQIGEVLEVHRGIRQKFASPRILELLKLVGLQNPGDKMKSYPHELSGGQRQRVMIAMALANEPDLLIADEPTTALDVTIQAQILELLERLQEKLGMAILLITHDLGVVRKVADRVCVMTQGEIVEKGNATELFSNPQHEYTQHLLSSEPGEHTFTVADPDDILLECKNIEVKFPLNKGFFFNRNFFKAVDDVSFVVSRGETLGIVGESGSGKTTLGMALLRLVASSGQVLLNSIDISALDNKEMKAYRRDMLVVFQDPYGSLSPRFSVQQIIEEGLKVHEKRLSVEKRRELVARALEEVGLEATMQDRYPHEFSGGQRQRIAVARALILKPGLLILDEPTSALDRSVQVQLVDLLRDLQKRHNLTYIFISHDLKMVRALSNRVMVMKDGQIIERGTSDEIFESPKSDYTRELISAAFELSV